MAKKLQRSMARPAAEPRPDAARGAGSTGGTGVTGGRPPEQRPMGRRVSGQAVTEFTVQLATLSAAGIPIARALSILEAQTAKGPFKEVVGELFEDVAGGTPLSEAMAKHGRAFDRLYSSMVKAGETAGVLDTVLERIAALRERAAEVRAKIVGALIYPLVVMLVAILVVSIVIVWVIPKFQEIFRTFDTEMPTITQILLAVSDAAVSRWFLVFGIPLGLVLLHFLLMSRSRGYRRRVHGLVLKLPLVGPIARRSQIAAFARTFGTLVQAGVPHLDALGIVEDTSTSLPLKEAVADIARTVREGEGISRPMAATGAFDELTVNMVEVGEQTGELDKMLLRVAAAYEKAVERRIDALFKLLEPAMLILLAGFVGFIVVALFMPLMSIMSQLGAG